MSKVKEEMLLRYPIGTRVRLIQWMIIKHLFQEH